MKQKALPAWQLFDDLPPEAQQQVLAFIEFLRERYAPERRRARAKRTGLADDPFIGMWRKRQDMADSTAWVRNVREREWVTRRE